MVCGSLIISTIILDWIERYFKKKPFRSMIGSLGEGSRNLLVSSVTTVALIILGATIEASLA